MHLYELPLIFVLIGLALYTVLAGADFGAGFWQLTAGSGPVGERISDHAHDSMAPVWEANHVWLIFVLTVTWTAYPTAFGAIASTLAVPLFIAALGIILRGATYALRSAARDRRERRRIDAIFGVSSVITPFALGTMVGAIASARVPPGNAAGHMFSSWLNPTSLAIGVLAVASSAYLAAVFMAADAARIGDLKLARRFRARALLSGSLAGLIALGGLIVLSGDSHRLFEHLFKGAALAGPVISSLAGMAALELVRKGRFELARYVAALAVAAVIGGWALAQSPMLLPGLTVSQAAAPHDTLVALVVAVLIGALVLFPSLGLLAGLLLRGRLDHGELTAFGVADSSAGHADASSRGLALRIAGACLIAGVGLLGIAEAGWAHAIGVLALLCFIPAGLLAAVPEQLAEIARETQVPED
jgi:cytochrome d ubiquinol oxidase subunit II